MAMSSAASSASKAVPNVVPVLLAFVGGAVDACTFFSLFGLFVAQLTGSFITIGIQLVKNEAAPAIHLLAVPLFFLAGVATVLLARSFARRALALVLAVETVLLAVFMVVGLEATPFAHADAPSALLASSLGLAAMGVQSATVRLMLPGVGSTNVMTVNTTQLAIDVTQWVIAAVSSSEGSAKAAAARGIAALGPMMAAFFAGTVFGAIGFTRAGFWSLLPLVAVLAGLVWWASRRP
jgi:uncharacterized membrane protein YoaK (UPF0700 family)